MAARGNGRLEKFLRKDPRAMLVSIRWNILHKLGFWLCKARFDIFSWSPKGRVPVFLAYYPDIVKSVPESRELYRRWIRGNKTNNNGDAARFLALLLNVRQLQTESIPGDFAELGVWKGNSAAILAHFASQSGRRLFLFDTFTGFDNRDLVGVDEAQNRDFADTSVNYVRETVGHDEVTTYVQGFFPDTVTDEMKSLTFALAHVDCDLYAPAKSALEFFYPRMPTGGMLILHDYSCDFWEGIPQAVDEFCKATGEQVVLWPDKSGTAMIRKRARN